MARVIGKLLAGNRDLPGYLIDRAQMAALWGARVLFHSLSTAQSHKATFAVLGNIRKQGLEKLSRMPLGDVQARGSCKLKNTLVERVDSIEPTLEPSRFVLIVILSMGLMTPIIGCMKFTDDLAKVGTIISQVTDILIAPELPRPETDKKRRRAAPLRCTMFTLGITTPRCCTG